MSHEPNPNMSTGGVVEDASTDELSSILGEVEIDTLGIDDIAAVFHLGEEIFTSEETPILYRTWDEYEVTAMFQTNPDTSIVARDTSGKVIGFVLGTTIEKNTAWTYGYIVWLGVHRDWQRRRVGDLLMLELEKRMTQEGVRMFLVDTSADNKPAIRFFENMGFSTRAEHLYLWKTVRGDAAARKRLIDRKRRAFKEDS